MDHNTTKRCRKCAVPIHSDLWERRVTTSLTFESRSQAYHWVTDRRVCQFSSR